MDGIQSLIHWSTRSISNGLAAAFSILAIWLSSRIVYNVYFHPLRSYPGPWLARATTLPYAYHTIRGTLPFWIASLFDAYDSEVVRLTPGDLTYISPEAWRDILGRRAGHTPMERDERVLGKSVNQVHSILSAPTPDHRRMRRILDHAFTSKSLEKMEPPVTGHFDRLVSKLNSEIDDSHARGRVDIQTWIAWLFFDVIGDLSFGESFHCMDDRRNHPWIQTIFGNLKLVAIMGVLQRFAIPSKWLNRIMPAKLKKAERDHFQYVVDQVKKRQAKGEGRADFMTPIQQNNESGKSGMSDEEIHSSMSIFVVAGSESKGSTAVAMLYYLLKNPEWLERIEREIQENFRTDGEITRDKVMAMPYLDAVFQETLRIYPVAFIGGACVVPPGGDDVCGRYVSGGTGVTINQWAAFHSPKNFSRPDDFLPERWLDLADDGPKSRSQPKGSGHSFASDRRDVYYPFSYGPRNCIGQATANAEVRQLVSKILFNFEVSFIREGEDETEDRKDRKDPKKMVTDPDWLDQKVWLTWEKKPLWVRLRRREH